jgi:hypothetical protein
MNIQQILKTFINTPPNDWGYLVKRKLNSTQSLTQFDETHPCVFVLSTGRVGSQTLAALCSLAPNVLAYHEPKPYLYKLSRCAYDLHEDKTAKIALKEAFLSMRQDLIQRALFYNRGYVETSPQVTFLAPVILEAIPNVSFIHLVRDPHDVVRSGMRRKWYESHAADINRISPSSDNPYQKDWANMSAFRKNVWLWAETNRWILDFTANLPEEQTILVHSESIFNANKKTLEKIFYLLNSPLPSQKKIKKILGKTLNVQKEGHFPKASEWSDDLKIELNSIAGDILKPLGYQSC